MTTPPPTEIEPLLARAQGGIDLTMEEMSGAIDAIMQGQWNEDQIRSLLQALAAKGEAVAELAGAAQAMRRHMTPIRSRHPEILDTCGTGGGGSKLFNISTTTAIVAAAAGVPVAKHGNYSITSRSGSADVLIELGVNIHATVPQVEACLNELGLCFCFAPLFHQSMKHVSAVRKRIGIRTIFNLLGPLVNPAGACYQLLGAGRPELRPLLAGAAALLGTKRTLVVSGEDGLGDLTLAGKTNVTEVVTAGGMPTATSNAAPHSTMREFIWQPGDFGIAQASLAELEVEDPAHSARVIRAVLAGEQGAAREIVVLNTAAALLLAGKSTEPKSVAAIAAEAIDSGAAAALLARLAERSHAAA
jgi:anthranilate phosphoribosyltransferase